MFIITNKDKKIECDLVVRGNQYAVLHIYTHSITPIEAYQIFGDPEETKVLKTIEFDGSEKVYHGFTDIYSVQKARLITGDGEILIWLQQPMDVSQYEEVI